MKPGERSEPGGLVPPKTKLLDLSPVARKPLAVPGDEVVLAFGASVLAEARVARLKRSVWASGHLHKLADKKGHRPPVCWFVTLTYDTEGTLGKGRHDWQASHVRDAVQRFRNWCASIGVPCRYTWVAEIQPGRLERTGQAVVHYHLLAWLPVGVAMPKWDRRVGRRAAFWPHGMTNTQPAVAGVGYLMKYLSKLGEFHRFPKGLRLYGIGGLDAGARAVRAWFNLPEWAKSLHGVGELVRKCGRLVVQDTGEILASPYRVRLVPGGLVVRLVGELVPRWFAGAYSRVPGAVA